MARIRCVVERITYQTPENGYSILKCRVKDYADLVPVVGNLLDTSVGSVLLVEGNWKVDPKYGRQFMAESWEETMPATIYGMEKYLGSGLIKGVGPKFAKRIVQTFGTETFHIIEEDVQQLTQIKGIGQKRVKKIAESWEKQKEIKNVMLFLQQNQVSTSFAAKIYRQYGNTSIAVMKENPYRLADDIWGIGFKTADQIAEKLGFGKESPVRLRSGLMYTLSELSGQGHVYARKEQLTAAAAQLLEASAETVTDVMEEMIRKEELIQENRIFPEDKVMPEKRSPEKRSPEKRSLAERIPEKQTPEEQTSQEQTLEEKSPEKQIPEKQIPEKQMPEKQIPENKGLENPITGDGAGKVDAVYLPPFYYAEIGVAAKLKKLQETPANDRLQQKLVQAREKTGNPGLSVDVSVIEEKLSVHYDEIQAEAIRQAAQSKILILTGGPGTGKTTTTHGIISMYQSFSLKLLLAAPTGRAAKRMTEATGLEAKTIHRLLECKPPQGYQKNEDSPIEGDVLILDECSMIDILLMNALLKAIPSSMRLVLVGDIDQLPSVGPGNVLRDMIDSGSFSVVRLTKIFRQARESRIIMNAHRINEGKMPDLSNGKKTDFFFIEEEDPEEVSRKIVELVQTKLPQYYKTDPAQIQVLTPMQRGPVGATSLNLKLQEALNPPEQEVFLRGRGAVMLPKDGLSRSGFSFRTGDKVMQIRNNYEKEVFNGDIGIIHTVNMEDRTLEAVFDSRTVEYDVTELDELVHAYATTIHKAQGSEYPIVVMPVLMSHYVMLQRNLLYTGITRAKKILVLTGTKKAIAFAVRNVTVTNRNTMLKERLQG